MNSKLLTCMEDGVDRLEYVLEQVSSEINGVQEKMDDIKIEVLQPELLRISILRMLATWNRVKLFIR